MVFMSARWAAEVVSVMRETWFSSLHTNRSEQLFTNCKVEEVVIQYLRWSSKNYVIAANV